MQGFRWLISIFNPEVQAGASTGYMIHITNPIDAHELECLKAILEKNHLAMKSEVNTILIYKPAILAKFSTLVFVKGK